jgi:DNA-binding transcriptional MerR regulator
MEPPLTVGQLGRATGVSTKTIRYYEQAGVLPVARRSASGYRQYARRDVHRLLFIRRARALGLSIPHLKALTAALDREPCLTMRPRLQEMVTAQLCTVRQQIAEFYLLEQQLAQVLHRLLTLPPSDHAEGCHCLETDGSMVQETAHQSPPHTLGGEAMSTPDTLESFTVLATTTQGSCGCGCACGGLTLTQLTPPSPRALQAGAEESARAHEHQTGDTTRQ